MKLFLLVLISLKLLSIKSESNGGFADYTENDCPSDKCTCDSKLVIKCVNFESFTDLNFEYLSLKEVDVLDLKPSKPIQLDDSLKLHSFRINKQVILRNLAGFSYKSNPFTDLNVNLSKEGLSVVELKLYDSEFEFYETSTSKLNNECTVESFLNQTTLLAKFSKIWLNENTKYSQSLCPLVFKNANIDLFLAHQMNSKNRLKFRATPNLTDVIKSRINYLSLINAKLDKLDSTLVDRDVFSNLKTFQILGSLNEIQTDFFNTFKFLKSILFELFNFSEFIRNNSEWMAYLKNDNIYDSNKSLQRDLLIILNDKNKQFEYADSDFCLFRHFPNENLVYPVIKTKFNLTCSCTLFWLLKNWKMYKSKQGSNIIQTQSVDKCINNNEMFEDDIEKCDLNRRIIECNDTTAFTSKLISSTTTIMMKTTTTAEEEIVTLATTDQVTLTKLTSKNLPKAKMPLPPLSMLMSSSSPKDTQDIENELMKHLTDRRRPPTRQFFYTTSTVASSYSNYFLYNPISIIDMAAGAISLVGFFVVVGVLGFILFT